MGCINGRDTDDTQIQAKEYSLQIILCTVADIRSGYICLDQGDYISYAKLKLGFENMQNILSASLTKQEAFQETFKKFIAPFKEGETDNYNYKDLLLAYFVNSKSTTIEKAIGIAELYFRDKTELEQSDLIFLFKQIFKVVLSYSFSLIDKFTTEQKNFDKAKSKEEEEKQNASENEQLLLLKTGEYLAGLVAESLVEKDKKLKISEFAEKCKTFITDRFYRDLLVPKELRMSVRREYNNQDGVDRVKDEKVKKEKEEKERKEKEEKAKKEQEEKEKKEKEAKEKKEKEAKEKKEQEEKAKQDKEKAEKEKADKEKAEADKKTQQQVETN